MNSMATHANNPGAIVSGAAEPALGVREGKGDKEKAGGARREGVGKLVEKEGVGQGSVGWKMYGSYVRG